MAPKVTNYFFLVPNIINMTHTANRAKITPKLLDKSYKLMLTEYARWGHGPHNIYFHSCKENRPHLTPEEFMAQFKQILERDTGSSYTQLISKLTNFANDYTVFFTDTPAGAHLN